MSADLIIVLCFVAFFGTLFALILIPAIRNAPEARRQEREAIAAFRAAAEAQYRAHRVPADDPRFSFDPDTATVVVDEEFCARNQYSEGWYYRVERIARNAAGEYFKIVYGRDVIVRFAHIEHRIAKIVLKDRYLAPGE